MKDTEFSANKKGSEQMHNRGQSNKTAKIELQEVDTNTPVPYKWCTVCPRQPCCAGRSASWCGWSGGPSSWTKHYTVRTRTVGSYCARPGAPSGSEICRIGYNKCYWNGKLAEFHDTFFFTFTELYSNVKLAEFHNTVFHFYQLVIFIFRKQRYEDWQLNDLIL